MSNSDSGGILWSNAGNGPRILFGFCHVSVVIPALMLFFVPGGIYILMAWMVIDWSLVYFDLTLRAALMRSRLWFRGGIRRIHSRRKYQKIKQGK